MHTRDQQPFAVARDQELRGVRYPRGPTGQHHDAVGFVGGGDLGAAQLRHEAGKAGDEGQSPKDQHRDDGRVQPPSFRARGRGRRLVVGWRTHAISKTLSWAMLESFLGEVESNPPQPSELTRSRPAWQTASGARPRRWSRRSPAPARRARDSLMAATKTCRAAQRT